MRKIIRVGLLLLVVLSSTAQKCDDGMSGESRQGNAVGVKDHYKQIDRPVSAVPEPSAWIMFLAGGIIIYKSVGKNKKKE